MLTNFFKLRYFILLISLFFLNISLAKAGAQSTGLINAVKVCPVQKGQVGLPDFTAKECFTTTVQSINPRNTHIWVKVDIALQETQGPQGEALALYITSKMAANFYLNGQYSKLFNIKLNCLQIK